MASHHYSLQLQWTGNRGNGTESYRAYDRSYEISIENKPILSGSSDPDFLGDKTKYNPEELLLASLSSCHMLWFLHLCAEANVVVIDYKDSAKGVMTTTANGSGRFESVTLFPVVIVKDETMIATANELHKKANEYCFIANSVNFPVLHEPSCETIKTN